MNTLIIFLKFTFFPFVVSSSGFPTRLFLNRVGPCYDAPSTVISISEFSIKRSLYNFTLYGELNITQDMESDWKVKATMQKCQDIRNLDTCDFYKSFKLISIGCSEDVTDEERDLYTGLFASTLPKMQCPVQAGQYKIKKYPFFSRNNALMVSQSKISTSVFGYTFRIEGYNNDDERILCADAVLRLIYLREREMTYEVLDDSLYKKLDKKKGKTEDSEEEDNDTNENDKRVKPTEEIERASTTEAQAEIERDITDNALKKDDSTNKEIESPSTTESQVEKDSTSEEIESPSTTESQVEKDSISEEIKSPSTTESQVEKDSTSEEIESPSTTESQVDKDSTPEEIVSPSTTELQVKRNSAAEEIENLSTTESQVEKDTTSEEKEYE